MSASDGTNESPTAPRSIVYSYEDPLELIWRGAAKKLGIQIKRSSEVFASWDGKETLSLGEKAELDPDDSVAQMVLHELCHALVEGEDAHTLTDWGLRNEDDQDATREFAAMRLQAALLAPHGLRRFLAVTTDWRSVYDALPSDPLVGEAEEVMLAKRGYERATQGPWASVLGEALEATAALAQIAHRFANNRSLWSTVEGVAQGTPQV